MGNSVKSESTLVGGPVKSRRGQGAGQEVSPAGVGDHLDSTTKDNEH